MIFPKSLYSTHKRTRWRGLKINEIEGKSTENDFLAGRETERARGKVVVVGRGGGGQIKKSVKKIILEDYYAPSVVYSSISHTWHGFSLSPTPPLPKTRAG